MRALFSTIVKSFFKFFNHLTMYWWVAWSNFRFRDSIRTDLSLITKEDSAISNWGEVYQLLLRLYHKYTWTKDGVDQLWDAITPPPQNYSNYLSGGVFDDCDGFHSLVHYALSCNGIESYLLAVTTLDGGHCTLLVHLDGRWCVVDYTSVSPAFDTPEQAVANYAENYPKKYGHKYPTMFCGLVSYDYTSGKFYYEGSPSRLAKKLSSHIQSK